MGLSNYGYKQGNYTYNPKENTYNRTCNLTYKFHDPLTIPPIPTLNPNP